MKEEYKGRIRVEGQKKKVGDKKISIKIKNDNYCIERINVKWLNYC